MDSAAGVTLCLHRLTSVTKLSTAPPKLLAKNLFLCNVGKCLSMSQKQHFVGSISNLLTYTRSSWGPERERSYPKSHSWRVAVRTRTRISKSKSKVLSTRSGTYKWKLWHREVTLHLKTGPLTGKCPGKWCLEYPDVHSCLPLGERCLSALSPLYCLSSASVPKCFADMPWRSSSPWNYIMSPCRPSLRGSRCSCHWYHCCKAHLEREEVSDTAKSERKRLLCGYHR